MSRNSREFYCHSLALVYELFAENLPLLPTEHDERWFRVVAARCLVYGTAAVSIQNNAQDTQFTGDNQSVWNKELPHQLTRKDPENCF
jgi:hypothetical protein